MSVEESVARLFAPDMVQEVQVRKFEDAFDKVTREAIAREEARTAFLKFFEETYNRISTVDLPAIAKEIKSIKAQVRTIENEVTRRKDKDVSQSIMDRLASFIQQGLGEQQEVVAQKIENMPGYIEEPRDVAHETSRIKSRKEIFDTRITTTPSEQHMTPVEDEWREDWQILDAELTAKRSIVERQLHIIDLEAILADHAQDILMINSSILKVEMKLNEVARRAKKSEQKVQEQQALAAVMEQRRTALNEFWAATNAIPGKIELRTEVYTLYQEKSSDWAGSVDELTDTLRSAVETFQFRAKPLQDSLDKILAMKGPILDDCHQHRAYLRMRMRFDKTYCVDPSAWDINNVGRSSLDMIRNTVDSLNHEPGGLKSLYPTTVVERHPPGSLEKTKLAREVKKMRSYLSELHHFGNDLTDARGLFHTIAMRKFRHSLQNDKLRLKQLETIGPFMVTMNAMLKTMGAARWIAFDQKEVHASIKGAGARSSSSISQMDKALRSRLVSEDIQPFLKFYYRSRQTLNLFNALLDEFLELFWERLKFEAKFPEFQHLAVGTRPKRDSESLTTWQQRPLALEAVRDPLDDRGHRDITFAKWANAMHFVLVGRPVQEESPHHYCTNPEIRSKADNSRMKAPITSAAAYQLEQSRRAVVSARDWVARTKLKKLKDATRAEWFQRDTTVDTHAGRERSSRTSITRGEEVKTAEVKATDETFSDIGNALSSSSSSIRTNASKYAKEPISTAAAATLAVTPAKEVPAKTGGFMFARRVGAQLRNALLGISSSTSPPESPALKPQVASNNAQKSLDPQSPLHYFSYRSYTDPSGNPIKVHYLQSLQDSEKICSLILSEAQQEEVCGQEPIIGFDMEWKMNATLKSSKTDNLSVIQLATPSRIAIIHLSRFYNRSLQSDLLSPSLRVIMESDSILKCGVNIKADCTRFTRVLDVVPQNIYEISLLYRLVKYFETDNRAQLTSKRPVQLATQVEEMLGIPMEKSDTVRTGDWSKRLDIKQTEYAASDAFASMKLFQILESERKRLPHNPERPPMVLKTEPKVKEPQGLVSSVPKLRKVGVKKPSSPPAEKQAAVKKIPVKMMGSPVSKKSVASIKEGMTAELDPIQSTMRAPKSTAGIPITQRKSSKTSFVKSAT
ncbi:hypothetical protein KEM54_006684 [Ascosphaera aggregata]|nr:hypothetical protein KEM54_006684 [Ascosphaera aggregata]